jgi:N-acetylneuraminic acid mutarotase
MIYVMSGYGGGANRKQCYKYNPATNAWTTLAQVPNAVWAPMIAAKGNFIYLFGGQNTSNAVSNLVQIYNSQTNTWSIGAPMPAGLMQGQAITSYNGKIYLFGGRTAASGGLSDLVRVYNPDNNTWTTAAPMMIPKAQFAAVLNNDGRIYIVGGRGSYQPNVGPFFHSVEIYNPSNNTWDWGPDLPSAVGGTTLVNSNGNLFLMGGIDGSYRNYNWRLVLPPVAPTTSKATATSSTQIKVEWHDASGNENRFEVERSLAANGPWTVIATTAANVNTYINTGRVANTTYFYRVRPANSSGYGPYGPVVSAKTWATGASARKAVEEAITVLNLQSAPNPFSGLGKVSFVAQETGRATVLLFDLQGNQVQQIFDNDVEKGEHQMGEVNGSSLLGGMYLLRVINGSHSESIKLILNK